MKKTLFVMLLIIGAMAMFVGFDQMVDAAEKQKLSALQVTNKISAEWKVSGKAEAVPSIAGQFLVTEAAPQGTLRAGCMKCHDGYGAANFTYFNANQAEFNLTNVPHSTGIDCQACHSGVVKDIMNAGSVKPAFADQPYTGLGTSASCLYCHDGNRTPTVNYAASAAGTNTNMQYPHYGMQGGLWSGMGAMHIPGEVYKSSKTHASVGCVDCHMPVTKDGYKDHTFAMDVNYIDQTCGSCHAGVTDFNYNNLQTEIYNKLKTLRAEIVKVSGADDFTMSGGQFRFMKDGKQMELAQINRAHDVYYAVYSWRMVYYDKSNGVHNPAYAKDLIDKAYHVLTGENLR